ncbi:MAG: hypothetical protein JXL97_01615 [Bacteroidales bacterium]|nr:hypothetical protein [Bacteroidales bacterium]
MSKFSILFLLIVFLTLSCKNSVNKSDSNSDNNINTTTTSIQQNNVDVNENTKQALVLEHLPNIIKKYNSDFYQDFLAYLNLLNSFIDTEDKVLIVLAMRDSMMVEMSTIIDNYYYNEGEADWDTWALVDKELDTIGFWTIYAEGMFVALDVAPILENEIEQYTSEEFKTYIDFKNKFSQSLGGEYPFMNVSVYYPAIMAGEKMYKNFKSSKYFDLIYDDYLNCLSIVTDMHKVSFGSSSSDCFYSNLTYSFYPFATSCDDLEFIIDEYPNSMFIPIFKKITNNMSVIDVDTDNENAKAEVFAVVIDKFDNYKDAGDKIFEFLHQGKDIVHNLSLKNNNDETLYYTCYRFYSNKQKAEDALKNIKSDFPNAKILHVIVLDDFGSAIIVD